MNELQLLALAEKALHDNGKRGHLFKRTSENSKWQMRYFVLFQNILFYFESETTTKPSGLIFLEGSYVDKMVTPNTGGSSHKSSHVSNSVGTANLQVSCTTAFLIPFWVEYFSLFVFAVLLFVCCLTHAK